MKINIVHLYPDLLNLYSDKGNIMSMRKRLEWRGIETEVNAYSIDDDIDFSAIDVLFVGGGADREQIKVCNRLLDYKNEISSYIENDGVMLATCGGFEMLGHYFESSEGKTEGLGILDTYTKYEPKRLIGNIIVEPTVKELGMNIVGFENHAGRTYINDNKPLGMVLNGFGNNDKDEVKYEGVIYRNLVATNLSGPLLPKNPQLCDYILTNALIKKTGDAEYKLAELDDKLEICANDFICNKMVQR